MFTKVEETVKFLKENIGDRKPLIGLILGSGLGEFADQVTNKLEIPYEEIPHFHKTSVVGHKGRLVFGTIQGIEVVVFQGRFHAYEGHSQESVVMPVRAMGLLGVKKVIITNAAGGINSSYVPGDLVCIEDHINMTGLNPLIGKNNNDYGDRFPDMTEAYNKELNELLYASAKENDFTLKSGVYAAVNGPSYETPAEIKMLKVIGADLVGMSTFAETIAANHMGLKVCGISCVTNLAAGMGGAKLNHDEVKEVANLAMKKFTSLLINAIGKMG